MKLTWSSAMMTMISPRSASIDASRPPSRSCGGRAITEVIRWDLILARAGRLLLPGTLTLVFIAGTAAPARAQGFISPLIGFNFGGVSGCPELRDCENKQRSLSLSFGKFGSIFGAETEFAYTPK